jgi:hypothetical protein
MNESSLWVWALAAKVAEGGEPRTVKEAMKREDWDEWLWAIKAELESLKNAKTWTLVERPTGVNIIRSKWVFKIK